MEGYELILIVALLFAGGIFYYLVKIKKSEPQSLAHISSNESINNTVYTESESILDYNKLQDDINKQLLDQKFNNSLITESINKLESEITDIYKNADSYIVAKIINLYDKISYTNIFNNLRQLFKNYCKKPEVNISMVPTPISIPINIYYDYIIHYSPKIQLENFIRYVYFLYYSTKNKDENIYRQVYELLEISDTTNNVDEYYKHLLIQINKKIINGASYSDIDDIIKIISESIILLENSGGTNKYYPDNITDNDINYIIIPFNNLQIDKNALITKSKELLVESHNRKLSSTSIGTSTETSTGRPAQEQSTGQPAQKQSTGQPVQRQSKRKKRKPTPSPPPPPPPTSTPTPTPTGN